MTINMATSGITIIRARTRRLAAWTGFISVVALAPLLGFWIPIPLLLGVAISQRRPRAGAVLLCVGAGFLSYFELFPLREVLHNVKQIIALDLGDYWFPIAAECLLLLSAAFLAWCDIALLRDISLFLRRPSTGTQPASSNQGSGPG